VHGRNIIGELIEADVLLAGDVCYEEALTLALTLTLAITLTILLMPPVASGAFCDRGHVMAH